MFATATASPSVGVLPERRRRAAEVSPAVQVLALQRAVGNRAVAGLLQRKHVLPTDQPGKIAPLQKRYPKLELGASNLTEAQDAFWEEKVQRELADVIRPTLEAVAPEPEDRERPFQLTLSSEGPRGVNIKLLELVAKEPRTVIQVVKENEAGGLDAKIVSVYAPARGKRLFKEGLLPVFADLGVRRLTLEASFSGGKQEGLYVWARYGFVPPPDEWDGMRERGRRVLDEGTVSSWGPGGQVLTTAIALPSDLTKRVDEILESSDPKALRNMVALSWRHRANPQVKALLDAMLASPWHGTLNLDHADDRAWIAAYADSARDPDATIFEDFLTANLGTPKAQTKDDACCIIL